MNIRTLFLLIALGILSEANSQSNAVWTATVVHATTTTSNCGGGSIDLHSNSNTAGYTYRWKKFGESIPFSYDQDVYDLEPGLYNVGIQDEYCGTLWLAYHVWLLDYDFDFTKINPSDCEADKPLPSAIGNGLIQISWNENVAVPPHCFELTK
ncbi:MAG: hypothetical protein AB8F78_11265 [Saprospiraceae bacterium]